MNILFATLEVLHMCLKKKESEHEATVKFAYQELCEQVFLSNLTIFVSLLNKGFKKPLSCRIVASCLM